MLELACAQPVWTLVGMRHGPSQCPLIPYPAVDRNPVNFPGEHNGYRHRYRRRVHVYSTTVLKYVTTDGRQQSPWVTICDRLRAAPESGRQTTGADIGDRRAPGLIT